MRTEIVVPTGKVIGTDASACALGRACAWAVFPAIRPASPLGGPSLPNKSGTKRIGNIVNSFQRLILATSLPQKPQSTVVKSLEKETPVDWAIMPKFDLRRKQRLRTMVDTSEMRVCSFTYRFIFIRVPVGPNPSHRPGRTPSPLPQTEQCLIKTGLSECGIG